MATRSKGSFQPGWEGTVSQRRSVDAWMVEGTMVFISTVALLSGHKAEAPYSTKLCIGGGGRRCFLCPSTWQFWFQCLEIFYLHTWSLHYLSSSSAMWSPLLRISGWHLLSFCLWPFWQVKWNLNGVLVCLSPMAKDVEYSHVFIDHFYSIFWKVSSQFSFATSLIGLFDLLLYVLHINNVSHSLLGCFLCWVAF